MLSLAAVAYLPSPATAAETWLAPVQISTEGQPSEQPQIVTNASDVATAAWREFDGSHWRIMAAERPADGPFGGPVGISAASADADELDLSGTFGGESAAVWVEEGSTDSIVQVAEDLVHPDVIDLSEPGEKAVEPQIEFVPGGGLLAVWRLDGGSDVIQVAAREPGQPWSDPVDVSATGVVSEPQITSAYDDVVVVWKGFDGSNSVIQASRRIGEGEFLDPEVLSEAGEDATEPQVAMDWTTARVIWSRAEGGDRLVQESVWNRQQEGATFGDPVDLSADGGEATEPRLAIDGNRDTMVAAWVMDAGLHDVVQAAVRHDTFFGFSSPQDASELLDEASELAVTTSSGGGRVFLVWRGTGDAGSQLEAAHRRSGDGGVFSEPAVLGLVDPGGSSPAINYLAPSDVVAVWASPGGGGNTIQFAGFDAEGPHWGVYWTLGYNVGEPSHFEVKGLGDLLSPVQSHLMGFGDGEFTEELKVTHFYCAGEHTFTFTATDGVGNVTDMAYPILVKGSNAPEVGAPKVEPRAGTATVAVRVPCPGMVTFGGNELRPWSVVVERPGVIEVPVVPDGLLAGRLERDGAARIDARLDFEPRGLSPISTTVSATLLRQKPAVEPPPQPPPPYWRSCVPSRARAVRSLYTHLTPCSRARAVIARSLSLGIGPRTRAVRGFRCRLRSDGSPMIVCHRDDRRFRAYLRDRAQGRSDRR